MQHIPQLAEIHKEAFYSKRCMGCPCPCSESAQDACRRYAKYPAEKLALGAVAIDEVNNSLVLGVVQMTRLGLPIYPEGLHTCEVGEYYIETIAVSSAARGRGIGTKLLQWCEDTARSHSARVLVLGVVNGNRAKGLYERFGFRDIPPGDVVDVCCIVLCVFCVFGRPYGWCNPAWGATDMRKVLDVS